MYHEIYVRTSDEQSKTLYLFLFLFKKKTSYLCQISLDVDLDRACGLNLSTDRVLVDSVEVGLSLGLGLVESILASVMVLLSQFWYCMQHSRILTFFFTNL